MLDELEAKKSNLLVMLKRISGAIQVPNELLNQEAPANKALETSATSDTAPAA
jgi:hypothetical protein